MSVKPDVVICTATLDPEAGLKVCSEAVGKTRLRTWTYIALDRAHAGGVKTANEGLRWALEQTDAPYICYMNDDVDQFPQGWLERMIEALESNEHYCTTAPGGHCATAPQCKAVQGMPRGVEVVKHVSHFCVVHKRSALVDVGLFDEAFYHYGCDNDWNLRAVKKGWQIVWVRDVWVNHFGCHPGRRVVEWMEHDQALYKKRLKEGYYV